MSEVLEGRGLASVWGLAFKRHRAAKEEKKVSVLVFLDVGEKNAPKRAVFSGKANEPGQNGRYFQAFPVAIEPTIAGRPPHRSGQARFTHPALTAGN